MELQGQFTSFFKNRELTLWSKIAKAYNVDNHTYQKVRNWILKGTIAENAIHCANTDRSAR